MTNEYNSNRASRSRGCHSCRSCLPSVLVRVSTTSLGPRINDGQRADEWEPMPTHERSRYDGARSDKWRHDGHGQPATDDEGSTHDERPEPPAMPTIHERYADERAAMPGDAAVLPAITHTPPSLHISVSSLFLSVPLWIWGIRSERRRLG